MRFALMMEPQQGLSYDNQLTIARHAERIGFEAIFRADHYQSLPGSEGRPTTDAWAALAGLARETSTISLGVLVSPVTFRTPGNLAKVVATVDEMSHGRVELGLGTGWYEPEHFEHGFPFPPIEVRAQMLEETLEIVHGLWEQPDGWSFRGRYWEIRGARFAPKPVMRSGRRRPPIILGGGGTPRSYRLAARFADEFNVAFSGPNRVAEVFAALDVACEQVGRRPSTMIHSALVPVVIAPTLVQLNERCRHILGEFAVDDSASTEWLDARRDAWIIGTPAEVRHMIHRFSAAGVERMVLQDFLPFDEEMIDLLGEQLPLWAAG